MRWSLALAVGLVFSVFTFGQQATETADAVRHLDRWRLTRIPVLMDDFGELGRYRDANRSLPAPTPGESRVVFFGDSITDGWRLADYFPAKPYINRGIGGQTTPQMLLRFRQDVSDLRPRVVVILAGTNDLAGNTGPMRSEDIEANYASMAELAHVHQIAVVFSSILPVHNSTPRSQDFFSTRPMDKIRELNRWLRDYSTANGHVYLDYFSAMLDDKGLLKTELSEDGLHPNAAGYRVMAPLAEQAIQKALSAP
jgi:lysophospholipase L1-like esterase